jgi:hypothetical protein
VLLVPFGTSTPPSDKTLLKSCICCAIRVLLSFSRAFRSSRLGPLSRLFFRPCLLETDEDVDPEVVTDITVVAARISIPDASGGDVAERPICSSFPIL